MADDKLPNDHRESLREQIKKEDFQASSRDPHPNMTVIAGLVIPTQQLISTAAIDAEFHNPPGSVVTDQEIEGFVQNVADFIAKCWPFRKSFFTQSFGLGDVMALCWASRPMAVAWKLNAGSEAILNINPREVVPPEESMIGNFLRAVVKITVNFPGRSAMSGSGFLIDDWTVVTVGHLLVNHCGCARGMRIWAGRGGDENTIESRDGMYVAVHNGWFEGYSECNDLAFIRLSEPFNTVNPLEYKQTPITHNGVDAAIYGYPCDLPENSSARGNRLCVSRSSVRYGWSNSTLMLEHEGDTERGNSGGPVVDHMGTVIALHRGWAPAVGGYKVNEAVAINHGGNDFEAFLLILEYMSWEGGEGAKVSEEVKMLGKVKEVGGFAFAW